MCRVHGMPIDTPEPCLTLSAHRFGQRERHDAKIAVSVPQALRDREESRCGEMVNLLQSGEMGILARFPAPVYVVDGEWRLLLVSEEGAAAVGRTTDELTGRTMWENYPDLRGTVVEHELTRALETGARVHFEHYYGPLDSWFSVSAAPFQDGLLITFDDVSDQKRAERRSAELAAEQAALARIADAIARSAPPRRLFAIVAEEAARLSDIEAGAVVQFTGPGTVRIVGVSSRHPNPLLPSGDEVPDLGIFERLRRSGELVHLQDDDEQLGALMREHGRLAWLQVPIFVAGGLWGALVLSTSVRRDVFDDHAIARQRDFAELLSVAIGNADAHDRLARMAATDPVTGLANHRVFHARLREAAAEAVRRGRPLTVAVFDLDRFRDVNDLHGHLAGDEILREAGARLSEHVAPDQLLARIGGDEFALVMPGWTPETARPIVERAAAAIAARPFGERRSELTLSAGIADLEAAGHGELLFACADGALYWAKLNGRDLVCTFEPSIVNDLSPTDRAETLLRRKTLAGITALARAIDAKDPTTRQHSERVAQLVDQLARVCGWQERRIRLLREAALVHDVGKIGIPDAILLQTGRLTAEQYEVIKRHAPLGADIVDGVLLPEQVEWVRHHHERPDGGGYPDGLDAPQISSGCALLSVADTLDVMTVSRPYSRPLPLDEAVAECERLVGAQFMPEAALALRTLYRMGALEDWDVAPPANGGASGASCACGAGRRTRCRRRPRRPRRRRHRRPARRRPRRPSRPCRRRGAPRRRGRAPRAPRRCSATAPPRRSARPAALSARRCSTAARRASAASRPARPAGSAAARRTGPRRRCRGCRGSASAGRLSSPASRRSARRRRAAAG